MKKIYKMFRIGDCLITYNSESPMCDFDEVHKGIIENGRCLDMCISRKQALKEIKNLEKEEKRK